MSGNDNPAGIKLGRLNIKYVYVVCFISKPGDFPEFRHDTVIAFDEESAYTAGGAVWDKIKNEFPEAAMVNDYVIEFNTLIGKGDS